MTGRNLWVPKSTWRDSQDSNEMSIPRKEDVPKDRGAQVSSWNQSFNLKRNMFPDIQAEFSYDTHFTHIDTLLLDFTPSTEPGIGKLILGGVEREDALRNLGYPPKLLRSPGIIFGCSLSKNVHNSKTAGCMILTQRYTKMLGRTSNRGLHSNLLLFSSLFTFFLLSDMVKKTTCQIWIWSFSNPAPDS